MRDNTVLSVFRNTGKHASSPFPRSGVLGHDHEVLILIQRGAEGVGLAFFFEGEQVGNAGQGRGEWSLQGVVHGAKQRTCTITKRQVERSLHQMRVERRGRDQQDAKSMLTKSRQLEPGMQGAECMCSIPRSDALSALSLQGPLKIATWCPGRGLVR